VFQVLSGRLGDCVRGTRRFYGRRYGQKITVISGNVEVAIPFGKGIFPESREFQYFLYSLVVKNMVS